MSEMIERVAWAIACAELRAIGVDASQWTGELLRVAKEEAVETYGSQVRAVIEAMWEPIGPQHKDGAPHLLYSPDRDGLQYEHWGSGFWESFAPYEKEMGAEGVWSGDGPENPTHAMRLWKPEESLK